MTYLRQMEAEQRARAAAQVEVRQHEAEVLRREREREQHRCPQCGWANLQWRKQTVCDDCKYPYP